MTFRRFVYWAVCAKRRSKGMKQSARSSHRVAQLLIGALLAAGIGVAAVATSNSSAEAAACQGCVVISAPTINLNVNAQPGEQAVIDQQGGVAVYTPLTTAVAGGPGTMWVVGHRTTHGSVFNHIPMLAAGDPIDLVDDAGAHRYIVSRLIIVSESDWQTYVDINDMSRSLLILQTSHPDRKLRYLIEAFGTGLAPAETISVPTATTPVVVPAAAPVPSPAPTPAPAPEPMRLTKFGAIKSSV